MPRNPTAGESHATALVVIVDGAAAGVAAEVVRNRDAYFDSLG